MFITAHVLRTKSTATCLYRWHIEYVNNEKANNALNCIYKHIIISCMNFTSVYFILFLAVRFCEPCTGTSGAEKLWSRCVGGHQVSSNGLLYYIMENLLLSYSY